MDSGTIVALVGLGLTVIASVAWLSQRAGALEQRVEALATQAELAALRERISLAEVKHVSTREAVMDLSGTLKEFREDMRDTLREFREEITRLVNDRLSS